jgi:hypothetical protein
LRSVGRANVIEIGHFQSAISNRPTLSSPSPFYLFFGFLPLEFALLKGQRRRCSILALLGADDEFK